MVSGWKTINMDEKAIGQFPRKGQIDMTFVHLNELISQLEAAKEGSGSLDDEIFKLFRGYRRLRGEDAWIGGDDSIHWGASPLYTFSLDAAKDLIETGMLFAVEGNACDFQAGRYGFARIWCANEYSKIKSMAKLNARAEGGSPALALCAAALKLKLRYFQEGLW